MVVVPLTHLQAEEERQKTQRMVRYVSLLDLRRIRAWYLDIVTTEADEAVEIARLRGEIVHAQIESRESALAAGGMRGYFARRAELRVTKPKAWGWLVSVPKASATSLV